MNLSKKGLEKIYDAQSDIANDIPLAFESIEFEADDFEGCIVLTVDEAKRISMLYEAVERFFDTLDCKVLARDCCESKLLLNEKIEQAEG